MDTSILHKISLKKIIVFIIVIFVLYWAVQIVDRLLLVSLRLEARSNSNYLKSLDFLDGREFDVIASPNGDVLTASSSPATATLELQEKVNVVHSEITANLTEQGYVVPQILDNVSFGGNTVLNKVGVIATDGKHTIGIAYFLKDEYACKKLSTIKGICPDDVVEKSGVLGEYLEKIQIRYDPKAGANYHLTN